MIFHWTFRKFFILFICILIFQLLLLSVLYNFFYFKNTEVISTSESNDFQYLVSDKYPCKINDSQAISALNRIKTQECRQNLIDNYCLIKKNKPWPDILETRCNLVDKKSYKELISCLDFNSEILKILSNKKLNKILLTDSDDDEQECVDLCFQIDFEFALFHSNYCICTNNFKLIYQKSTHYLKCDLKCSINFKNCPNHVYIFSTGIKKTSYYFPGLYTIASNDVENFIRPKIVFLLLLSGRSVFQVNRLLKNIYYEHHYYYIHIDSRDTYMFEELIYLEKKFSNIKLSKKRFDSIWGGSSLLTTILTCISNILNHWKDWDFVLNLSETDFPIKKIDDLEQYLIANNGKNFVKSHGKNAYDFIQTQALNKVFVQCERRMWRIANRHLIKGIIWDGGSDWVILSRNFSEYLTYSKDPLLMSLINYFQYSLLPAESFFHVLLRNTEFCKTIVNNNLRATNWNRKKGCKCQQKHIVDWCGCSPNVFRLQDVSRLMSTQSKPLFFARKFEHVIDSEIIDFVELRFLSKNFILKNLNENYYLQNTYHYQHDHDVSEKFRHIFYKFFANQSLTIIKNNCPIDSNVSDVELLETNILFKNHRFSGTLVKFSQKQFVNFEMILKKFANDTILFSNQSKPKLKSIKVCDSFDEKDEVFRDFECLISQQTSFQVWHEWQPFFGIYHITFIFLNWENRVMSQHKILLNNTKTDEDSIKLLYRHSRKNYPLSHGLWKLIILNNDDSFVLGIHRFMILPVDDISTMTYDHLSEVENENMINLFIIKYPSFFTRNLINYNELWFIDQLCVHKLSDNLICNLTFCDNVQWSINNLKIHYIL